MRTLLRLLRGFASWLLVSVLTYLSFPTTVTAQAPASGEATSHLPSGVRERLQKNAAALSAVHLEYTKAQAGRLAPPQYDGPLQYSAYFDSGRFYQHRRAPERHHDKSDVRLHEDAFDGKTFYFGEPDLGPSGGDIAAVVTKYAANDATDPECTSMHLLDFPYLNAAGFCLAQTVAELATRSRIESLVLQGRPETRRAGLEPVAGKIRVSIRIPEPLSSGVEQIDLAQERKKLEGGRNSRAFIEKELAALEKMKNMARERVIDFLLDPELGYGVVERDDWTPAGNHIVHIVADQWKHYEAADVWLPGRCVESYFTSPFNLLEFSDQPVLTDTLQLERAEFGPQNVAFALDYKKPGSQIVDRASLEARNSPDHQVSYMVAADEKVFRDAAGRALNASGGRPHLWLWVNLGVLVALVVALVVRQARRGRA